MDEKRRSFILSFLRVLESVAPLHRLSSQKGYRPTFPLLTTHVEYVVCHSGKKWLGFTVPLVHWLPPSRTDPLGGLQCLSLMADSLLNEAKAAPFSGRSNTSSMMWGIIDQGPIKLERQLTKSFYQPYCCSGGGLGVLLEMVMQIWHWAWEVDGDKDVNATQHPGIAVSKRRRITAMQHQTTLHLATTVATQLLVAIVAAVCKPLDDYKQCFEILELIRCGRQKQGSDMSLYLIDSINQLELITTLQHHLKIVQSRSLTMMPVKRSKPTSEWLMWQELLHAAYQQIMPANAKNIDLTV